MTQYTPRKPQAIRMVKTARYAEDTDDWRRVDSIKAYALLTLIIVVSTMTLVGLAYVPFYARVLP